VLSGVYQLDATGLQEKASQLARNGKPYEAIELCSDYLQAHPDAPSVIFMLHRLLGSVGEFAPALELLLHYEYLGNRIDGALADLILAKMHCCDWEDIPTLVDKFLLLADTGLAQIVDPAFLLALRDDPQLHQRIGRSNAHLIARFHSSSNESSAINPCPTRLLPRHRHGYDRIRVGYLSGDFFDHPMPWLMEQVIKAHDRERFEVLAFDYSIDDGSGIRARILTNFDRVIYLSDDGAAANARQIAEERVDVLIDLKGYTQRTRSEILAYRPAPIQVAYLGYSGTQGASWIDYIIADRFVLPAQQRCYWDEAIAYMPHCFYPSSENRPDVHPYCVLEENSTEIALACLNNNYKISREVFDIWIEVLVEVPNARLVLFEGNPYVAENLRRYCELKAFDASRISFLPPCPRDHHIQRLTEFDLILDTFPYGAHTTAADALWAGVPVVTCPGNSFASRVCSSMLIELGLQDMVVESIAHYRAKIIQLARDKDRLLSLRTDIVAQRRRNRLFSSLSVTTDLEGLILRMQHRYETSLAPADICV
jgi:protein O-GlcNAc transferase